MRTVTVPFTSNHTPLPMLAFFHRRAKHRTVVLTLAVWVFALVAGVGNACVLQVKVPAHDRGEEHMHSASKIETHAHLSVLPQSGAPAPADAPCSDDESGKAQCKSFCDVEASAAAAKQQGSDATDLAQVSMQVLVAAPYLPPLATAKRSFDDRPPPSGAPMVIRFLRLTI